MTYNKTEKFWEFEDTKSHKNLKKGHINPNILRVFTFSKSYLLEVYTENPGVTCFVIPMTFQSQKWPDGFYTGFTGFNGKKKMYFMDRDIVSVIG
jgi:hypothetical protein